jgi:hypothetical protein
VHCSHSTLPGLSHQLAKVQLPGSSDRQPHVPGFERAHTPSQQPTRKATRPSSRAKEKLCCNSPRPSTMGGGVQLPFIEAPCKRVAVLGHSGEMNCCAAFMHGVGTYTRKDADCLTYCYMIGGKSCWGRKGGNLDALHERP